MDSGGHGIDLPADESVFFLCLENTTEARVESILEHGCATLCPVVFWRIRFIFPTCSRSLPLPLGPLSRTHRTSHGHCCIGRPFPARFRLSVQGVLHTGERSLVDSQVRHPGRRAAPQPPGVVSAQVFVADGVDGLVYVAVVGVVA